MSFIENCRQLISIDSSVARGNKEVAEFLGQLCKEIGLYVEYQRESLDGLEQCNLIARPTDTLPEQELMLQTHLDTTDPGHFSLWTRTQSNPFNASIYNDLMFGLGVAESKLDFLCKLEACRVHMNKPFRVPFVLAGTYGAHRGMAGAIKLVRKKKVKARWALVGSPTSLELVVAGQGLAVIEIFVPFSEEEKDYRLRHDVQESSSSQSRIFSGRGAQEGDKTANAIVRMLGYLAQLPSDIAVMDLDGGISYNSVPSSAVLEIDVMAGFKEPITAKLGIVYQALLHLENLLTQISDDRFDPPHPTMNIGTIRTSQDGVTLTGCCRMPPSVRDEAYNEWMKILRESCDQSGATFRVRDYRAGFETSPQSEFVGLAGATLKELDFNFRQQFFTGATEASVFSRWGIECLVWGPGQSVGNSHGPNESIKLADLNAAVEFYRKFLERFCL